MRQRPSVWVGWGVLFALHGAGCASSTPPPAVPDPQQEAQAPGSYLVSQELPAPEQRAAGPESPGTPVFLAGHDAYLLPPDISPDGQRVLVASNDGAVSVLDLANGTTRASRRVWASPARGGIMDARFDATGTRVLLTGDGPPYADTLFVWDLLTDTLVPGQAMGTRSVSRATFTSDGAFVVATAGGLLEVRDAGTLVTRRSLLPRDAGGQPLLPDYVWVSPTSTRMIAVRGVSLDFDRDRAGRALRNPLRSLHLYDAEGALVAELRPDESAPPEEEQVEEETERRAPGFRSFGFRPGGGQLATVTSAGVLQLRHPETGAPLHDVALPGRAVDAFWTRGGELLLVLDGENDNHVHFVDPASGARVASVTMSTPQAWPFDSMRQADGSLLVFSERELDAFSGTGEPHPHPLTPFRDITDGGGWTVRVSANGARAVVVQEPVIHTLDLERGVTLARRAVTTGPRSVWGAVFVPGGVLMTTRESGVLFRANSATRVYCASAGARLRGEGASLRVVGARGVCGLDDAAAPATAEAELGLRMLVLAESADRTTRVVLGDAEVTVQDVRTGRVRMRVPAADRSTPECPECNVQYTLSPDGALLAVFDTSLPLALFDTRTGRRLARLEKPGRSASWVEWSAEGNAFAVQWNPLYDAQAAANGESPTAALAAYDRRGRELLMLQGNPEDHTGGMGAVFTSTHAALFIGSRASVVELRRRTVTALTLSGEGLVADWLGTTLRLTVTTEEGTEQLLFAPGATTPHFQHEGAGTFTADARFVFRCREGELERLSVADLTRTSFGPCIDTALFPSDDARFVAMPQGDHLRVVRDDGVSIRLAALSDDTTVTAFAVAEATGRFTTLGTPLENERYRYRQAGPAISAPLVRASAAAGQVDAQLLERFFGAAAR
ncbi:MAG: hypothetical protein IPL19_21485 [Sandaracinaceae bacterium]|nr:hypothetical protein [Sandaracinaceae bacterium]